MGTNKNAFAKLWEWLGHLSRAIWVYHFGAALAVGTLTLFKGLRAGVPVAYLIPLTVVAAGGMVYLINQFSMAYNRFREGYAFGLAYEGITLGFDPQNPNGTLQLGVLIRNVSEKPLRYRAERFDVVVEDRTIVNPAFDSTGGIIPRGASRRYSYPPFKKEQTEAFIGKSNVRGSITFEFHYGHPDGPDVRQLKMRLSITLRLTTDGKHGAGDSILSERDEPL